MAHETQNYTGGGGRRAAAPSKAYAQPGQGPYCGNVVGARGASKGSPTHRGSAGDVTMEEPYKEYGYTTKGGHGDMD